MAKNSVRASTEDEELALEHVSGTYTVACKLPHGLRCRLYEMSEEYENVMGGGSRLIKKAVQVGGEIVLNGNAVEMGKSKPYGIVEGYALTHGVDQEFFDAWLEQNKDHPAVVNNLIFAASKASHVEGRAREMQEVRSNLEPLNPIKDPRVSRGTQNVSSISTAQL